MQYKAGQSFYGKGELHPNVITIVYVKDDLYGILSGWSPMISLVDEATLEKLIGKGE